MITNKLGLPQPFVDAVTRDYKYKDKQYSVTSLLKGACQVILERRHLDDVEQDVSEMIWLIFGTAVHSVLEKAQETDNQLKENKVVIDVIDGYKLSGIFDLYDDETGTVTDYKTGSVWKVKFDEWEDYRKQTLLYCYMLQRIGFNATRGEIVHVMKDWSKTEAKRDKNYPQTPVFRKLFEFSKKDFEYIEQFVIDRFKELQECEKLKDSELPYCTEEERWHKEDKWAVMKKGVKRAVRVLESEQEAQEFITMKGLDNKHYIEFREGSDTKCQDYCPVSAYCPFYQKKYGGNNGKVE